MLIDLHCHLDGTLDLQTSYQLALEREIISSSTTLEQFKPTMIIKDNNQSLEDFLACFTMPSKILQDEQALTTSTIAVIRNLSLDDICYAEIRFAPQLHTLKGLSQEEVLKAVIKGVDQARSLYPTIHVNLILCLMTAVPGSINHLANMETVQLAGKYLGNYVCGIDIAGAEGLSPFSEYHACFLQAKNMGVPCTMHAGEAGPASNVHDAIMEGAVRIGHGGHCLEDDSVVKEIKEKGIVLEQCPTSNVQTKSCLSFETHTLRPLYDAGVKVTINSDDGTLSQTSLSNEIMIAKKYMHFTTQQIQELLYNSAQAAFCTNEERKRILTLIK